MGKKKQKENLNKKAQKQEKERIKRGHFLTQRVRDDEG